MIIDLDTAKETALHNGGQFHLVWTCEASDHRQRPKGRPMTEGCGKTNVRTSKKWGDKDIKGRCVKCNRRRNLNEGNVTFFLSRANALEAIYLKDEWFQ